LTEKASGFSRRDVYVALGKLLVTQQNASEGLARMRRLREKVLADARVMRLLEPAGRLSGEVLRLRDQDGRVTRTVCPAAEQRFTTASLVACEHELLQRARARQNANIAVIPDRTVDKVLAGHPDLSGSAGHGPPHLRLGRRGRRDHRQGRIGLDRGTEVVVEALHEAGIPVLGVTPTAQAAAELRKATGIAMPSL
jgi:hypothetical protein